MKPIIRVEDVTFWYGEDEHSLPALEHVSLEIGEGSFVAVLGHNGSGKSTLAKHLNAILLPSSGKVYIRDMDTSDEEVLFPIRQTVGMVFQNPDNQIVATIVEEDVAFALENMGVNPKEIRERVDDALRAVDMYGHRLHSPHQLSGGQKQRVAIAGIVAMRPKCIVLDEPTAMLDPRGRREVMGVIRRLREQYGITVVLITHYMDEAIQCDRVITMDSGKIVMDGTPKQIFSQVEGLKELGLDVPQSTELIYRLRQDGIDLPADITDPRECVEALCSLLDRVGKQ